MAPATAIASTKYRFNFPKTTHAAAYGGTGDGDTAKYGAPLSPLAADEGFEDDEFVRDASPVPQSSIAASEGSASPAPVEMTESQPTFTTVLPLQLKRKASVPELTLPKKAKLAEATTTDSSTFKITLPIRSITEKADLAETAETDYDTNFYNILKEFLESGSGGSSFPQTTAEDYGTAKDGSLFMGPEYGWDGVVDGGGNGLSISQTADEYYNPGADGGVYMGYEDGGDQFSMFEHGGYGKQESGGSGGHDVGGYGSSGYGSGEDADDDDEWENAEEWGIGVDDDDADDDEEDYEEKLVAYAGLDDGSDLGVRVLSTGVMDVGFVDE